MSNQSKAEELAEQYANDNGYVVCGIAYYGFIAGYQAAEAAALKSELSEFKECWIGWPDGETPVVIADEDAANGTSGCRKFVDRQALEIALQDVANLKSELERLKKELDRELRDYTLALGCLQDANREIEQLKLQLQKPD